MRKNTAIHKILFVTLSNIGDVILTLPVLTALKQRWPSAEITVITSLRGSAVFEGDERVSQVLIFEKSSPWHERWKFIRSLQKRKFDLTVDLRRSWFGFLSNSRCKTPLFRFFRMKPISKKEEHMDSLRRLEGFRDITLNSLGVILAVPDSYRRSLDLKLKEKGITPEDYWVTICPGAKSDIKRWTLDGFVQVADRLIAEEKIKVVWAGTKEDSEFVRFIRQRMKSPSVDLSGETSLKELAALFERSSLVISNDSAPAHLADCLRRPLIVLFGPTNEKKYGPTSPSSSVIRRKIFCSPCEKPQCRFQHECMTELYSEDVFRQAQLMLKGDFPILKERLLVVRLDRIGDLVLSLPALSALKHHSLKSAVVLLTRPPAAQLLRGHPDIDEVIEYDFAPQGRHRFPFGYFHLIQEIRNHKFQKAIVLRPSLRAHLVPFLAGIPVRIGLKRNFPFLLTSALSDERHEGRKHESEFTLDVVRRSLGIKTSVSTPFIPIPSLPRQSQIVLHPGASCPSKRWVFSRFIELAERLSQDTGKKVILVGESSAMDEGELKLTDKKGRIVDLRGKTSLKELARLLAESELLISNDSGPVHIATAVGTPVLSLFGRNQAGLSPTRWRPLGKKDQYLQKEVGCVVCLAHRCTIDFECLKQLTVDEVLKVVLKIISVRE